MATAITDDHVKLTNAAWEFSIAAATRRLGLDRLKVLNDFTALAWGLPLVQPADWVQVGAGEARPDAALALIGPGTGLGVSGLVPSAGGLVPIEGEGGHCSLAPADAREIRDRATGVARVPARVDRAAGVRQRPAAVVACGGGGRSPAHAGCVVARCRWTATPARRRPLHRPPRRSVMPRCSGTIRCAWRRQHLLCHAQAAGDLALTLGARGGVYIAGGIVPRIMPFFERSPFRQRFEAKGRFGWYLSCVPTRVIVAPSLALAGAARSLDG